MKSNPWIILLSLILVAALVASWAACLRADPTLAAQPERLIFTWLLVVDGVFLLVTRAIREWTDHR